MPGPLFALINLVYPREEETLSAVESELNFIEDQICTVQVEISKAIDYPNPGPEDYDALAPLIAKREILKHKRDALRDVL